MNIKKLKHRIERLQGFIDAMSKLHKGKETSYYNYFAGWDLGYYEGQLSVLEDLLDEV
jgi:hypothetical protein